MITVAGLRKSYGELEAVRGIDLEVAAGEIFAFLGPNGAGKTTTVEILEGFRDRTSGNVTVLGVDPADADRAWRQKVGFVLQQCELVPELTVTEAVSQYAGYYAEPRDVAEGKQHLTIAVGCTGGRHRSITVADRIARELGDRDDVKLRVVHRDIEIEAEAQP